ncbi:hypothetical protein CCYA_CCYA13G3604 [Cyanidiococcus yangmingshanensis]|nr:hypothetical protein CCYA_CCYA13G3604 [Cyanidiococcus yangmingshanensis]
MYPRYCSRSGQSHTIPQLSRASVHPGMVDVQLEPYEPQEGTIQQPLQEALLRRRCSGVDEHPEDVRKIPVSTSVQRANVCAVGLPITFHQLLAILRTNPFFSELIGKEVMAFATEDSVPMLATLQVRAILDTIAAAVRYLSNLEARDCHMFTLQRTQTCGSGADKAGLTTRQADERTTSVSVEHRSSHSASSDIVSSNHCPNQGGIGSHSHWQIGLLGTTRSYLHDWFVAHFDHPYPSEKEKRELALLSGLTLRQVNDYFANKRMRCRRRAESLRRRGIAPDPTPHLHVRLWSVQPGKDFSGEETGRGAIWRTRVLPYAAQLSTFLKEQPYL